jgi:hypothetical protein
MLNQRAELSQQKRFLEQQKLQSNALKDRRVEDERGF